VGNRAGAWSVSTGALPAGLTLNGATGVISGNPTTAGTTNFTVLFTTTGGLTDTQALSIAVGAATAPIISTTSLPAGTVGQAYSSTLQTVGNKVGSWSVSSGALPAGLTLNSTTGVVSGTPSTAGNAAFTVVFQATSGLTDSQALSILVDPNSPPVISTTSLPNGTHAVAYSTTLQTVGNRTGSWSISSGLLPAGLTLNGATGVISGTPGSAGTSNFIVQFTATGGLTDSQALSITVV
jgi:predicted secreted protein